MMATVSGTHVQMEMVSRTHKCLRGNGLLDHLTSVEKIADGKSLKNPSHSNANSHPSYVLVVLQKVDSLEKKRRRFIIFTMTRSILEIIQSKKRHKK